MNCWFQGLRYRERGPMKSWRPETMAEAIWSVLNEGLSLSQVLYNPPPLRTYLSTFFNEKSPPPTTPTQKNEVIIFKLCTLHDVIKTFVFRRLENMTYLIQPSSCTLTEFTTCSDLQFLTVFQEEVIFYRNNNILEDAMKTDIQGIWTIYYVVFISSLNSKSDITKEWSLCHKLKFYNPYIFETWWCKPLISQS